MILDNFNIIFEDNSDVCEFGDSREAQDMLDDHVFCNTAKQKLLSPPISMPSSSSKINDMDSTAKNDSDLRECNFLRRMNQSTARNEKHSVNKIEISNLIISKRVESDDGFNNIQLFCSKVKLKLEKQPKSDHNFMKRAANRRLLKNQKMIKEERISESKSTIEYTETCEVW